MRHIKKASLTIFWLIFIYLTACGQPEEPSAIVSSFAMQHGDIIYVASEDSQSIRSYDMANGAQMEIILDNICATSIALDWPYLWFIDHFTYEIIKLDLRSGETEAVYESPSSLSGVILVCDDYIFFNEAYVSQEGHDIYFTRYNIKTGKKEALIENLRSSLSEFFAVYEGYIYCSSFNYTYKIPIISGEAEIVDTNVWFSIIADSSGLYYTKYPGDSKDGSYVYKLGQDEPVTCIIDAQSGQEGALASIDAIVGDRIYAYVTDRRDLQYIENSVATKVFDSTARHQYACVSSTYYFVDGGIVFMTYTNLADRKASKDDCYYLNFYDPESREYLTLDEIPR